MPQNVLARTSSNGRLLERALRVIPMGRRNWFFCSTEARAKQVATIQTRLATCRAHGIDGYTYRVDVLQRIKQHPASRIEKFTPGPGRNASATTRYDRISQTVNRRRGLDAYVSSIERRCINRRCFGSASLREKVMNVHTSVLVIALTTAGSLAACTTPREPMMSSGEKMPMMDMAQMCTMHQKMMAGKSPEEQQAMMESHMKEMHGSVDPQMVTKHREMMAKQCASAGSGAK